MVPAFMFLPSIGFGLPLDRSALTNIWGPPGAPNFNDARNVSIGISRTGAVSVITDLIFEYLPAEQDGQLIGARPFLQRQIVVG